MHVTEHTRLNWLLTGLETAQSRRLNRASNLGASWPKKISLWVSYNSITTRAVPHVAFFSVKLESCFVIQAFVPISYWRLSYWTVAKCSPAFQRLQGVVKAIIYCKFQLPGYQMDKNRHAVLSSGPACGSRWLECPLVYEDIYRRSVFNCE